MFNGPNGVQMENNIVNWRYKLVAGRLPVPSHDWLTSGWAVSEPVSPFPRNAGDVCCARSDQNVQ